jgi:uncharacterized RDD family membrane protein YckC
METEILDDNNYNKIRNVEYATFLDRFLAAILDFFITIGPLGYLMYLGYTGKNLVLLLLATILGMLYKPLMEGIWGATLGKMIMKVTMVDSDFDQIDLGQSLLKNAIYIVNSLIGLLGQFWVAGTDKFKEAEGFLEAMSAGEGSPYGTISLIWVLVMLVSIFAMLGSSTKQTLHDRLASTYCVKNSSFEA